MVSYGFDKERIIFKYAVDVRYLGQVFELQLDLDETSENAGKLVEVFHEKHLARYGCNSSDNDVEIVNYCLETVIPQDSQLLENTKHNAEADHYNTTCFKVLVDGGWINCDFHT